MCHFHMPSLVTSGTWYWNHLRPSLTFVMYSYPRVQNAQIFQVLVMFLWRYSPAAVGIGLHSVRNLWDENLHQRAQQEAVKCVDEVYAEPKFEYFREPFEARLYEYSKAWTDGEYPAMTFCMPFDNIVYVMLSNLEVKHLFLVEGANVISPTLTCGMVEVFTKLAVQNGFWKKTKSTCNLVI